MISSSLVGTLSLLPPGQARVMALVERYYQALDDPCPASWVAAKLHLHPKTVRETYSKLASKGWLKVDQTPATPVRPFLPPRE